MSSDLFILDKYFTELQKFWETEKKLQDASSSNEAVHLQRRLLSLSSELVTLRNHLHVNAPPALPAHSPHPAVPPRRGRSTVEVEDLIHMRGPLTEDAVVRALQTRFYNNKYYTFIGPVLVSVNPYTDTHNPLTLSAATGGTGPADTLAALVRDAVRQQADSGYPQAIVLAGASGSGKTYASMQLLRRLFEVAGGGAETDAFKHLAAAFTVLRSLGTAATPANNNSTRIGHFIEVQVTDGALYRTKIHCYFLDQTRVVHPQPSERNFHIFYQMLAGLTAEERQQLQLEGVTAADLRYLSNGNRHHDPEDALRFLAWKSCLGILGIPFLDVMRVLSAVLLLGNVSFVSGESGVGARTEGAGPAAALLGISLAALDRGLTRAGSVSPDVAAVSRDALAKALYCRTVATIVRRANSLRRTTGSPAASSDSGDSALRSAATASRPNARPAARSLAALDDAVRHAASDGFVGILDMFGFEECRPARLEQLCVNLCAETVQHFYNTHVFKSAAESCRDEGVISAQPDYADNVPAIDLISSLRGGLLAALDAECAARGEPEGFVCRAKSAARAAGGGGGGRLLDARPPHARRFVIRHFAGDVLYDAGEFIEANRDAVPQEAIAAFDRRGCDFGFAAHLFGPELRAIAAGARVGKFRASPGGRPAAATLTQDFHTRLDNLLRTLVHARPHFVRCIRANATEAPMVFERTTVIKQIRALQALETATLMASGYPHRMRFRAFLSRYRALGPRITAVAERDGAEMCGAVLGAVDAPQTTPAAVRWAVGKRHVFLSEAMRQILERQRSSRRAAAAVRIQRAWRRRGGPPPPRPRPVSVPPPPEKCAATVLRNTCTLFGLDLERPPPLPPSRAYTVSGGVKLGYPQARVVSEGWQSLRAGDPVLVLGAAKRGHVSVLAQGARMTVPHRVLRPP